MNAWTELAIPELFERQVALRGDKVAIESRSGSLSYRELHDLSTHIADAILDQRGPEQEAVCLLFEHDAPVPAAILGALKARKFFVTLDPAYPPPRAEFILADSGAGVLLTNAANMNLAVSLVRDRDITVIDIGEFGGERADGSPRVEPDADQVVYLSYTSGSTGQPKGAVQGNRSVVHKIMRHSEGWAVTPDDRIALFFAYSFGASTSSVFAALLNGATLCPFDVRNEPPSGLLSWLAEKGITLFHTVPTFFRYLTSTMRGDEQLPDLRLIAIAGETIYGSDVRLFQQHFGGDCVLQVGMGSTETGTVLQSYFDARSECPEGIVPPGYPTSDMEIMLLDDDGNPVPPGETGEIAVRSRYLFSGYWRRPDLTESVLLEDPADAESRIFLMRDLGKRLPDGRIMHVGRKDSVVKVRGHRVDLGEVERTVLEVPGVAAAVVTAPRTDAGTHRLVAHYVTAEGSELSGRAIRDALEARLPAYLLPAMVELESLPLTSTGKVDRPKLAAMPLAAPIRKDEGPRDHLEMLIAAIWERLLEIDQVGIREDFFELGGDSLQAARMVLEIERQTGREIDLADLAARVTIETVADRLEAAEHDNLRRPILKLQEGGDRAPLFFCHGDFIGGGVFCRSLARHLGDDQPFYAIAPHGFEPGAFPPTIESMAADRVDTLLALRQDGPVVLGGFCWGGFVALEMARLLEAKGKEVAGVLVIDSDPRSQRWRPLRRSVRRIAAVLRLDEGAEVALFRKSRHLLDTWQATVGVSNRLGFLWSKVRRQKQASPTESRVEAAVADRIPQDRHSRWRFYHRINQDYVAEPYDGAVTLFRSSRLQERYPDQPEGDWPNISSRVEIRDVKGDHWTCVTRHVEDIAHKMRDYLPKNV